MEDKIYLTFGDETYWFTKQEIILSIIVFIFACLIIFLISKLDFKYKQKIIGSIRCILAYILGIIGWLFGLIFGTIYVLLYGGYQNTNIIDIPTILMENIVPALISVNLSNYLFTKIFPESSYKTINCMIFYIILFINYGIILYDSIYLHNYINLLYVATGIVTLIYFINKLLNSNKDTLSNQST